MLPSSPDGPNLDSFSLADGLTAVADSVQWAKLPDMRGIEKTAELAIANGYYSEGDLLDASSAERGHNYGLPRRNCTADTP